MSSSRPPESDATDGPSPDPTVYQEGPDRYIRWAEDFLDIRLSEVQKRILRGLARNRRLHVESGNGVGKSFIAGVANLAFLFTNPGSTNMATSGTYSVLDDVLWKPMRSLYHDARDQYHLPGRDLDNPPRILVDDDWYFKCTSPVHPDNLEGRHDGTMMVTLEEIDKPDITPEHIDSAGSMITDGNDRFLAISNPPRDEANIAHTLKQSERWETIQFSSFDSHNVRVDAGEVDAEPLPGLVDLITIAQDWEEWNNEPWPKAREVYNGRGDWPGMPTVVDRLDDPDDPLTREQVLEWLRPGVDIARSTESRENLDDRWYRRRLGVTPPDSARAHRPWSVEDVRDAASSTHRAAPETPPSAIGVDVARSGGDATAIAYLWLPAKAPGRDRGYLTTRSFTVTDHNENEQKIRTALEFASEQTDVAIDALGEGSALADRLAQEYQQVHRFDAGSKADDDEQYENTRAEAHDHLGQLLDEVTIADEELRKEAAAAARTYEYTERLQKSGSVLSLTPKDKLKDRLGHSPDHLDASTIAAHVLQSSTTETVPSTWMN